MPASGNPTPRSREPPAAKGLIGSLARPRPPHPGTPGKAQLRPLHPGSGLGDFNRPPPPRGAPGEVGVVRAVRGARGGPHGPARPRSPAGRGRPPRALRRDSAARAGRPPRIPSSRPGRAASHCGPGVRLRPGARRGARVRLREPLTARLPWSLPAGPARPPPGSVFCLGLPLHRSHDHVRLCTCLLFACMSPHSGGEGPRAPTGLAWTPGRPLPPLSSCAILPRPCLGRRLPPFSISHAFINLSLPPACCTLRSPPFYR